MIQSKYSKNNIAYKSRPASSGKDILPPIYTSRSKDKKDFNRQNQVYNKQCGRIFPVDITEMKQTMHSCIIPLIFIHPKTQQQNSGTAFLISPNVAITVAHNIYDKNINKYHWDIKLCPSRAGLTKQDYQVQSYFVPEQFIAESESNRSTLHDYAFIKLKEPVGLQSYLLLTVKFNSFKEILAIYGYPGSRYRKQGDKISVLQYGLQRQEEIIENKKDKELKRLRYNISTEGGQSGCPVVVGRGERNMVIAIHKGGNKEKQFNYGRLITTDIILRLQEWRKKCKGAQFKCFDYSTSNALSQEYRYAAEQVEIIGLRPSQIIKPKKKPKKEYVIEKQQQDSDLFKQIHLIICQLVEPPKDREKPRLRNIRREENRLNVYNYFKKQSFWNQQTKNASQFNISNKIATKKYNNGMFQITSSMPISQESKIIFAVHSYSKTIILGLTKATNINLPYSGGQNMKGSIALSTDNLKRKGKIIINGEIKAEKKGFFIEPGESLTIEVNTKLWFIFFNTMTKSCWHTLDEQFCKGEWFIFASLKQEGDRVEVIM